MYLKLKSNMKRNRTIFLIVAAVVVIALIGYFVVGDNFSPGEASGSAIDGVKKATKSKSDRSGTELSLDGEEVQQLLQNDDCQAMMRNDSFR